jgi:hypothetical protein
MNADVLVLPGHNATTANYSLIVEADQLFNQWEAGDHSPEIVGTLCRILTKD